MDQYENRRRTNGQNAAPIGAGDLTRATRQRVWWTPSPFSRWLGLLLVTLAILGAMAVAGAIEGRADTSTLYGRQVAVWRSLTPLDHAYYCTMPRRDAVMVWATGIAESSDWRVPDRRKYAVSRRLFRENCTP